MGNIHPHPSPPPITPTYNADLLIAPRYRKIDSHRIIKEVQGSDNTAKNIGYAMYPQVMRDLDYIDWSNIPAATAETIRAMQDRQMVYYYITTFFNYIVAQVNDHSGLGVNEGITAIIDIAYCHLSLSNGIAFEGPGYHGVYGDIHRDAATAILAMYHVGDKAGARAAFTERTEKKLDELLLGAYEEGYRELFYYIQRGDEDDESENRL
jgi:hypothetical protein